MDFVTGMGPEPKVDSKSSGKEVTLYKPMTESQWVRPLPHLYLRSVSTKNVPDDSLHLPRNTSRHPRHRRRHPSPPTFHPTISTGPRLDQDAPRRIIQRTDAPTHLFRYVPTRLADALHGVCRPGRLLQHHVHLLPYLPRDMPPVRWVLGGGSRPHLHPLH